VVRVTVLLLFLFLPFSAAAKSPLQTVRKHLKELLNVLKNDMDKTLPLTDRRAEVHTTLISSDSKLPIHYKMIKNGGAWKVYDLVIENISLVGNYRSQFSAILRDKTTGQMLEKLRQKITSQ